MNEPLHLHVAKEKGNRQRSAKIWLKTLQFAEKGSLTEKELNTVLQLVKQHQTILLKQFEEVKKRCSNFSN
jgi:cytochrome c556